MCARHVFNDGLSVRHYIRQPSRIRRGSNSRMRDVGSSPVPGSQVSLVSARPRTTHRSALLCFCVIGQGQTSVPTAFLDTQPRTVASPSLAGLRVDPNSRPYVQFISILHYASSRPIHSQRKLPRRALGASISTLQRHSQGSPKPFLGTG